MTDHRVTLTFVPNRPGYRGVDQWQLHCTCRRFGPYGVKHRLRDELQAAADHHAAEHNTTVNVAIPDHPRAPLDPPARLFP